MKKQKNIQYLLVALVATICLITGGYALFGDSLNINGIASTSGLFNLEFYSTSVTSITDCTANSTISSDKNGLNIDVEDLKKPGSSAKINVVVKNSGNIAANLISIDMNNINDPDIIVNYPTLETGVIIQPEETYVFDIIITWDINSTAVNKNINFNVMLNYEQSI